MGAHLRPGKWTLLACVLTALGSAAPARAVSTAETPTWGTNDTVHAIARSGGTVYLGGDFTRVGPASGAGVKLAKSDGSFDPALPRVGETNGGVFASAPDGAGGWYVGGVFSNIGGVARTNLAHIRADNTVDPSFAPNPDDSVRAIKVVGSTVYIGGGFDHVAGIARNGLAALDSTGTLDSWNPSPTFGGIPGSVNALAASGDGSTIYVGGFFDSIGGHARTYLAAVDADDATSSTSFPRADAQVQALAVDGTHVYVGGFFSKLIAPGTTETEYARSHLGAIDGDAVDAAWNPAPDGSGVFALAVGSGGEVTVGGSFAHIGGQTRSNLARLAGANGSNTGAASTWAPNPNDTVASLAIDSDTTYVGGLFSQIGTGGTPPARMALAAVDSTGAATAWDPRPEHFGAGSTWGVNTVSLNGSSVYAGGNFDLINTIARRHLAAFDSTGAATGWDPSADGDVNALALSGGTIYAGGGFANVGSFARSGLAAIDTGGDVDPDWDPAPDEFVTSLVTSGDTLYAGGFFANIGGAPRDRVAAIEGVGAGDGTGDAVSAWHPTTGAIAVNALALSGTALYVGTNAAESKVLAFDPAGSGGALGGWTPPQFDSGVNALALSGSSLIVGGFFTTFMPSTERDYIAAVNASNGSLTGWNPGADGTVYALAASGSSVFVGGGFATIGGADRLALAELDAGTGAASSWDPEPVNPDVRALAIGGDGKLDVGGAFSNLHGFGAQTRPQAGYAQFGPSPTQPVVPAAPGPQARVVPFTNLDGGPGPVLDRLAPHASAAAAGSQRVLKQGGLVVFVTQDEDGTDIANATVSIATGAKVYKFKQAKKAARAGKKTKLKLGLSKKLRKALVKALGQKRKLTAKVTITATDKAGNRTTLRRSVKLKR